MSQPTDDTAPCPECINPAFPAPVNLRNASGHTHACGRCRLPFTPLKPAWVRAMAILAARHPWLAPAGIILEPIPPEATFVGVRALRDGKEIGRTMASTWGDGLLVGDVEAWLLNEVWPTVAQDKIAP